MKIEILGAGCAKCKTLETSVKQAVNDLGIQAKITKVEDFTKMVSYGVMGTPALVIDGTVKVVGRIPTVDEIKKIIKS